jgi:hypothetical protein
MQTSPLRRPLTAFIVAAMLAAGFAAPAGAAGDAAIPAFSSAALGEPPSAWKFATLPNKTPTKYSIVDLGGTKVLKVEAEDSYGNLVHSMRVQPTDKAVLAWRWRVDKLVDGADLKVRSGEDSAAKLCVFFDFDSSKLSLGERTKLALARTTTGEDVTAQTLCYVWDNKLPADTVLPSPFTKRLRFLVLQSGTAKLGQWVDERRNLVADYQRLFADELDGKIPAVSGVGAQADADNTHGHGLAYFGDITLTP